MLKKSMLLSLSLATIVLMTGCATMISGSPKISVKTNPAGAKIMVNSDVVCKSTPCVIDATNLENGDILVVSKSGFQQSKQITTKNFNNLVYLGALWGVAGVFSTTTDSSTGAMYKSSPNDVYIELTPQ